jgi:hypothetical protein
MQWFRITTLVDITRTQVFKEHIDPLKKKQQDNYNTLHQTLEMRAIIFSDSDPKRKIIEWNGKKELTWIWEFYIERDDIFLKDNDPTALMKQDLEYVPFINDCEETAKFENFFFSINKNIKVEFISS